MERERDSQRDAQTAIRARCTVTPLVEALPRTRHQVRRPQSGVKPRNFIRGRRMSAIREERVAEYSV